MPCGGGATRSRRWSIGMLGIRPPRPPTAVERAVDFLDVEGSGVEVPAGPLQHFVVLRMLGVLHHLQEMVVARQTADVLRRTGAAPGQNHRVAFRCGARNDLFEQEFVLPAIAEIVVVDTPVPGTTK